MRVTRSEAFRGKFITGWIIGKSSLANRCMNHMKPIAQI